ncbi:guanylate kinase [Oscillospiraceae bacterium WX1]
MMRNKRRGRLFIISAPSGTGKSTVIARLMQMNQELVFSVSATTRPPRQGEADGISYRFLTREAFEDCIRTGDFLEYAEYVGSYYGTPKKAVLDHLAAGEDVILDIDVVGCKQVKAAMPEAVTIFIVPPSMEELERRLRSRGTDDEEKLAGRLLRARSELLEKDGYDYVVVNDTVETASREILHIMDSTTD